MLPLSIPSPPISSFNIGPLTIHFYALCILTGIVIAAAVTVRRIARSGIPRTVVLDISMWAVIIGIPGGRFYHVFTHPGDYLYKGANLWTIFAVWDGGLAIFGSILFGTLGTYIGCRRAGIRFFAFADALVPGLLLAQAFGRLGNYFNQELYGPPTTLPWGLQIHSSSPAFPAGVPAGTLFQPLFLYEMIWDIAGAILIILLGRKFVMSWGKSMGVYFLWYGIGRAYLETLRLDPTEFHFLGQKINADVAIAAAIFGLVILVIQSIRHRGEPTPFGYLPGRRPDLTEPEAKGIGVPEAAPVQTAESPTVASGAPFNSSDDAGR
ncbi:prolipoprotein diacylglyceryl transferase [Microbacterium sp. NPDC076768]|uniref:prolipoprotein diacylglyceryl transferase n=1 Tax=Microbacterium sp. NPDC076768 TaxID=3154858 RepID=UPI00343AC7EE